jgi:hypothetical protein
MDKENIPFFSKEEEEVIRERLGKCYSRLLFIEEKEGVDFLKDNIKRSFSRFYCLLKKHNLFISEEIEKKADSIGAIEINENDKTPITKNGNIKVTSAADMQEKIKIAAEAMKRASEGIAELERRKKEES